MNMYAWEERMTGWYEEKNKQKSSFPDLDFRQRFI